MVMVRRGELRWSDSPMLGSRPVVVLSRDRVLPHLARPLVAPLTSRVRGLDSEVLLEPGEDDVERTCVVSLDNVQPLDRGHLTRRLGRLDSTRLDQVCRAMAVAIDCG